MDCWFDSGAMPYAQWHYPFENKDTFARGFPADYICEAVDQTRGWFYTLHAEAVLLHAAAPDSVKEDLCFRNVICLGHLQDDKGMAPESYQQSMTSGTRCIRPAEEPGASARAVAVPREAHFGQS